MNKVVLTLTLTLVVVFRRQVPWRRQGKFWKLGGRRAVRRISLPGPQFLLRNLENIPRRASHFIDEF
jgi:hypothetical protein